MAEDRKVSFKGSILGVSFTASVTKGSDDSLHITGTTNTPAGALPIDLNVIVNDDLISASGTLLGNEFNIRGEDA